MREGTAVKSEVLIFRRVDCKISTIVTSLWLIACLHIPFPSPELFFSKQRRVRALKNRNNATPKCGRTPGA